MQPTFSSSRILLPVRPGFILLSLVLALLLNFMPTASFLWLPDWVALLIIFWCVREPRHVGLGSAFVLGLLMDVADASLLGQHALAYILLAYTSASLSRRILWFPLWQEALHILPLLLGVQAIQLAVRAASGADFPNLSYFIGPFLSMMLWPSLTFLLLLPQYQPVERDDNRPI